MGERVPAICGMPGNRTATGAWRAHSLPINSNIFNISPHSVSQGRVLEGWRMMTKDDVFGGWDGFPEGGSRGAGGEAPMFHVKQ